MIDTEIQDTYSEIIERIRQLANRLAKVKEHTFYEDESFSDAIKSLGQDFDSYFLEGDDVLLLKKEVSKNIRNINRNINRDGSEFTYIKELDNLFLGIDSINNIVRQKSWADYFEQEYGDFDCEGVSIVPINKLLNSVKECCEMLAISRDNATEVLHNSLFIKKQPEEFPAINSFTISSNQVLDPKESNDIDADLNVKILIAQQSGLLTGEFHKLSAEKQYAILAILLNRSKANIKNALTAMYGDANTNKNPRNLPNVVEKTNDLITQKALGIPLIKNRKV